MASRRHFIASALGAGLALATQGCRQMAPQAARKRMIVDSQVHLWKAGLPVMFLTTAQSSAFARVAERHPQLTLIVDHMGVSGEAAAGGRREEAFQQTLALAKYPNVSVKLSAIANFSQEPYPFRDAAPYIRRLYDAYGARRCYWGTDITNSFARATYRQRITQFT